MARIKMVVLSYKEASKIFSKKELEIWSDITGDYSKKKNKSLVLLHESKPKLKSAIGSSYVNRKAVKIYKEILLKDKKVLSGYKIIPFSEFNS